MNGRKTEVSFVCIADIVAMPAYNISGKSTYICHLEGINGGRQVTEKPFTSKWKKEM